VLEFENEWNFRDISDQKSLAFMYYIVFISSQNSKSSLSFVLFFVLHAEMIIIILAGVRNENNEYSIIILKM
jgi:hypothetical protein